MNLKGKLIFSSNFFIKYLFFLPPPDNIIFEKKSDFSPNETKKKSFEAVPDELSFQPRG